MQEKNNRRRLSLTCVSCKVVFQAYPCEWKKQYCSKACADAAKKLPAVSKICPRCETPFTAIDKGEKTRKYCRKGCGPDRGFHCVVCGVAFTLPFYRWNGGRGKCCSRKCTTSLIKQLRVQSDIDKRIVRKCQGCLKEMRVAPTSRAVFCKAACRRAYHDGRTVTRTCKWCHEEFTRNGSQIVGPGGDKRCQFCSKSCAGSYAIRYCQKRVSAVEKRFFDMLEKRGVTAQRQVKVAKYNVDGLIPNHNTIIEFDGVYWHSQPATAKLDAKKEALFKQRGHRLIRVLDTEFKKNPIRTIRRVLSQLQSPQETLFPV